MRRRLVGHHVRRHAAQRQLRVDLRRVADQPDRAGRLVLAGFLHQRHRLFQRVHHHVHVADLQAALGALRVHLHDQPHPLVHRDRQGLRPAHPAQPGGQHELALQRGPAAQPRQRAQGLVGALQDALRADVDPRAGRHLPVHDQPLARQLVEVLLGCPVRHQVRVGDQHTRRVAVALEYRHRLARLHQQRLVILQLAQALQDGVEGFPVAGGLPAPAVNHQVLRALGHLGIQVVLDHAVSGFGQPGFAGQLGAAWRAHLSWTRHAAPPSGIKNPFQPNYSWKGRPSQMKKPLMTGKDGRSWCSSGDLPTLPALRTTPGASGNRCRRRSCCRYRPRIRSIRWVRQ